MFLENLLQITTVKLMGKVCTTLLFVFISDPPKVHLDALNAPDNTITIVAGNKLRLEIPISGEPVPRVVWMKGERVSGDGVLTEG